MIIYTDEEIRDIRLVNNISDIYIAIRTTNGGVVFVRNNLTALISQYESGALTGNEPVPAGVALRVQPKPVTSTMSMPTTPATTLPVTTTGVTAQVPILVEILAAPRAFNSVATVQVDIRPIATTEQTKKIDYKFNIRKIPIRINISEPIINTANIFLQDIINTYVDEERELKTLLNYGEDKQSVVLAYRRGPLDINGIETLQLKLLQPVPDDITINNSTFLSREVAKTIIDKVRVRFAPEIDATPYLRPKNLKATANLDTGKYVRNVTLNKLALQSGSVGLYDSKQNKTFEDEIFRQWYSYDFNSSELNINFSDYNNFVFYSSAALRLEAFKQKLQRLEQLEFSRKQILEPYTANTASAGFIYVQEKSAEYALQKEDIIRSFDRYEQYLYFTPSGSNSAYSASFDYVDGGVEFNQIGYWPKSGSQLYPVNSSISVNWYNTQLEIAQRFDEFNENNLVNTIPTHVREDHANAPYVTFVLMVGQLFDNIKLYIDDLPNIYSRNLNPDEELSKDLITEIAESLGFTLPTIDAVYDLTDNILGSSDKEPRRQLISEIYKRLLHNLPFFAKAKGTKTALQTFLNTFGITPQLLTVRETGTPNNDLFVVTDEYTTGLDFDGSKTSFVRLPVSASNRAPTTLQFNCTVSANKDMTILTGDDKWALNVVRHPSTTTLGRLELVSGSNTPLMTSSYHNIFGDELLNVAIQTVNNTSSLYFTQVDGADVLFDEVVVNSTEFPDLWNNTDYVFLGGAGARVIARYEGTIDEVRLWGTPLSDEVLLNTAFDPGSNAGDSYSDAADNLYVKLSFDKITSSSLTASSIKNESPYKNISATPSITELFQFNIVQADFVRYNRTIKQSSVVVGSSAPTTNKIIVASPPIFTDITEGPKLYRTKSIVPIEQKKLTKGLNKILLSMSPTDIVNQNIVRNLGLENINAVLGSPTTLYTTFDKSLAVIKNHYQQYYYVDVNTNTFIRILSDLSSVLNQVVDYFIPSRASLIKGIVIEPNILEQVKIAPIKNIRVYGKNARKTLEAASSITGSAPDYGATFNLSQVVKKANPTASAQYNSYTTDETSPDPLVVTAAYTAHKTSLDVIQNSPLAKYNAYTGDVLTDMAAVTGSTMQYTTSVELSAASLTSDTLPLSSSIEFSSNIVKATYNNNTANINLKNLQTLQNSSSQYETYKIQAQPYNYTGPEKELTINSNVNQVNKIPYNDVRNGSSGAEPFNRLYTRKLFNEEIATTRLGGTTSIYTPALYEIPPSADFRDFGVYTYFNNPSSIYYFNEIRKTPAYPEPINASWDFENQTFANTAATWSYGSGYNKADVVYQNISVADLKTFGLPADTKVLAGNGRYYVFKNRPAYSTDATNTVIYSGSVPSFIPPSLDQTNWNVLRFKPIETRIPRRVVFDTYTISDPALNNFKTTTISVDTNINIPDRFIDTINMGSAAANSYVTGEFVAQNIALVFGVQFNVGGIRLRLYRTRAARDADIARSLETRPAGSHGVLLDTTISSPGAVEISNPFPTMVDGETTPTGELYYTIDNLEDASKLNIVGLFYYFAIEIQPRIPLGYLKKHYRFFRDNSTATKRRNFIGCKNTKETTVDGLPPVQVFIGEGADIQVAATTRNQEIVTGGGGTLNVT